MDRWEGKIAVVTGASAGIGASIVEVLAKAGVQVVALARRFDRLEKLSEKLNGAKGKVYPKQCDVTKEDEIMSVLKWVESELGGVDILVNNAGVLRASRIEDDSVDSFRTILNVNVLAMAIASKVVIASMKTRDVPGHIININSIVGHVNFSGKFPSSLYAASKHAVTGLTESLRQELATESKNKIRITSVSPGLVKTDIIEVAGFPNPDQIFQAVSYLDSMDIANAVLYVLGTPENVLISELTIRPTCDKI